MNETAIKALEKSKIENLEKCKVNICGGRCKRSNSVSIKITVLQIFTTYTQLTRNNNQSMFSMTRQI